MNILDNFSALNRLKVLNGVNISIDAPCEEYLKYIDNNKRKCYYFKKIISTKVIELHSKYKSFNLNKALEDVNDLPLSSLKLTAKKIKNVKSINNFINNLKNT